VNIITITKKKKNQNKILVAKPKPRISKSKNKVLIAKFEPKIQKAKTIDSKLIKLINLILKRRIFHQISKYYQPKIN
jgi:hypothetical protein